MPAISLSCLLSTFEQFFMSAVIGTVVATAIFLPYPKHSLWSAKRIYPILLAGGIGILVDDHVMTLECQEMAKQKVCLVFHNCESVMCFASEV